MTDNQPDIPPPPAPPAAPPEKKSAEGKVENGLNRLAKVVTSIGVLLGVAAFFLSLFPEMKRWVESLGHAKQEAFLGYVWGYPDYNHLYGDQFYNTAWNGGLKRLDNIFIIKNDIIRNYSGQDLPLHNPKSGGTNNFLKAGSCVLVHDLRFSAYLPEDPDHPVAKITLADLKTAGGLSMAEALKQRLPASFVRPDCNRDNPSDQTKACGRIAVWATVTEASCSN